MADYEHMWPPVFGTLPSALQSWSLGEGPSDRSAVDRTGCFQSAELAFLMSLWLQPISISILQGAVLFDAGSASLTWTLLQTQEPRYALEAT
jgi:hypothetical protein